MLKQNKKKERERETKYISQLPVATWLFFFSLFALNELVVKIGSEVVGAGLYSRAGIKIREVLSPLASRLRFFITTARVDCQCIMWARTCCVLMQLMLSCCWPVGSVNSSFQTDRFHWVFDVRLVTDQTKSASITNHFYLRNGWVRVWAKTSKEKKKKMRPLTRL